MSDSYWKTTAPTLRRKQVTWPSPGQILRQVGIVVVVSLLWGGLLAGYLALVDQPAGRNETVDRPENSGVEAAVARTTRPTSTATQAATLIVTPTARIIVSPTPVDTPLPAVSLTPTAGAEVPVAEATPTPTGTSVPSPTPTDIPLPPPQDTPEPPEEATGTEISFSADVLPIFERRCVKCHGGDKTQEGLVLKSHADILAGSWNGPVIEPGSAADSYLVQQIVSGKMPKKEPHLLPGEIRIISDWIDAGAPDN